MYKIDEIRQAILLLDEYIRSSDDSEAVKNAQLAQVRQILIILDDAAKKGAEYYSRLPALYEALESVPWTQGARYRVDYTIRIRPGDEYQVASRLQITLSWLKHQAKPDLELIVENLTKDVYPDTRLALRKFKELLVNIMLRANCKCLVLATFESFADGVIVEETRKIREISPELVRRIGDAEDVLKWIRVW